MAFFGFGKKDKGTTETTPATDFVQRQKVTLDKSKADLNRVVVNLSKETGVNLANMKARVAVVMDHSGSIKFQFENGNIQNILTRILPFALQFDDNGELEVFIFDDICRQMDVDMNEENYATYVKDVIMKKNYPYGGTQYAPAIHMIDKYYNDTQSKVIPTLVFFITDGNNYVSDHRPSDKAIIESSDHGIFIMFIGSGNADFDYLRHLDNLDGRKFDNTGFMSTKDLNTTQNATMFMESLKDYIPWLKAKGYIH